MTQMTPRESVAIVTGGSRGIGRAIAIGLAEDGVSVVIGYHSRADEAEKAVKTISLTNRHCLAVQADISRRDAVNSMVDRTLKEFGRIDILVNCAGVALNRDFMDITEEEWEYTHAVNSKSIFLTTQAVVPHMRNVGGGRIVNVTSISGILPTGPEKAAYCSAKAAAIMLTMVLARALAPYNITVNTIAPGTVSTDLTAERMKDPEWVANRLRSIPMGRIGQPVDIVEAARYFVSPNAGWTTGAVLVVDGGQRLT